jgi:uncharacterized protein Veg
MMAWIEMGRSRTTKPRPAPQSIRFPAGANVGRHLAMTHRHGRNISANHGVEVLSGWPTIFLHLKSKINQLVVLCD